ncbi:adenylate/guanylate cyclase domain-containing protein [Mycobacterium koreense]|uniref:adenylate/guanylate cyclase domain-containing protein n=1 Tax=Mycolicibacillus koreensis TaxID=1069220 RepID=UPI000848AD75|nr:adenylate/guanylate cyclase domain-containing protein [Mycolicibacillus koreensis]MCV7249772.1 adenylate/guanylate cyclase domain-containing protein [Mycolicibacillus koreensis]ODR08829.1 cyclase [Mycolicibacillus koreensis]BBY52864.1 pH-sensitive adenylate cyclase [Mycolicibacillus koreensis]
MTDPSDDGLLDGLAGQAREERAELVSWLLEQGVTPEEIGSTVAPMLLAMRRQIGDDGHYVSTREIADAHGMDLAFLQRVQRAIGLARVDDPDAAVFTRADAEAAAAVQPFVELGLDPDDLVLAARVLADGLADAAEVMRHTALGAVLTPGATELETAQRSTALLKQVAPLLGSTVSELLLVQLRQLMETEAVTASERAAGTPLPGAREITVAFADLVGFTRLGETVPPEQLERLANRLAELGHEVAVPPVRMIKTIGDAVMLVCPDPAPLVRAVLRLVALADDDDELLRLRAGVAAGPAVSRAGDWFGSPVNLASRVTGVARPGSVLVTEEVRDAIGADDAAFRWSFAGPRRLKGIGGDVKLFRARPSDPPR